MVMIQDFNWVALAPSLALLATMLVALVFDMGTAEKWAKPTGWVALIGSIVALLIAYSQTGTVPLAFGARGADGLALTVFAVDRYTRVFTIICLLATALSILLSMGYLDRFRAQRGEYYVLMLLAALGMILLAGSLDLILIFLGIELLSLPLYILAGFRRNAESSESSMKYFLLGAFSSGFFLYGIALVFGATGSTNLTVIASSAPTGSALFLTGMLLILVGFCFKVAAVPFHQWAPDVYQGAPTPVTGFFASAPKVAAFAGLIRVYLATSAEYQQEWTVVFAALAALTMTVGNLIAVTQGNVKRMLAYSSVAHVGYVLVGLSSGAAGVSSATFYLAAYAMMSLGAFGVLSVHGSRDTEMLDLADYAGLGFRRPLLAVAMTVFLVSLAGFPPTVGFIGKFLLFRDAYDAGLTWLVVIGVLNSVVSAFYYLGVVVRMYMTESTEAVETQGRARGVGYGLAALALVISLIGVIIGGVMPARWMNIVDGSQASKSMTMASER